MADRVPLERRGGTSITGPIAGDAVCSLYVRTAEESFGTDQDGLLLRARGCARRARLGPVFPLRRPRPYAWLGPCRHSAVQDAAGPCSVPVLGHTGGPQGTPHAPRPRGALQITAATRRRPGGYGGRRHGGDHTVLDDRLAGDVARRRRPRLRCGGGPQDRHLRQRGPHGDPAGTRGARGLPREGQRPPSAGATYGGRIDPATTHAAGPRPFFGQPGPARRPTRNGWRPGRGDPRPSYCPGR